MQLLMAIDQWVDDMRKVWGPDWAKHWKDWIEHQRQQGRQQIHANARMIEAHERQATLPPGYYAS
jgi:hypothetical protein